MQRLKYLMPLGIMAILAGITIVPRHVLAMSEFSREYRTPCNTCHIGFPHLNDLGKAFKDAGFTFPKEDLPLLEKPAVLLTATSGASALQVQTLNNQFATGLKSLTGAVQAHNFPYRFRLTPTVESQQQPRNRSEYPIRFGKFDEKVMLEISGVYDVAYSSQRTNAQQRMSQTFRDVVLPILRLVIEQFRDNEHVQAYAFEVSEHVRGRVLGVLVEGAENIAWVLPRDLADKLIATNSERERQALISAAQLFLNAELISGSPVR